MRRSLTRWSATTFALTAVMPMLSHGPIPREPLIPLKCSAYVSDQYPVQKSHVLVYVHSLANVAVHATAHFKTSSVLERGTTDRYGNKTLTYSVGTTSNGYKVRV